MNIKIKTIYFFFFSTQKNPQEYDKIEKAEQMQEVITKNETLKKLRQIFYLWLEEILESKNESRALEIEHAFFEARSPVLVKKGIMGFKSSIELFRQGEEKKEKEE